MPGPGSRAKAAAKAKKNKTKAASVTASTSELSLRDAFVDDVDHADGWTPAVNLLCRVFELPDMTTRRGLKKILLNFDSIYKKLDTAYQRNLSNERIRGSIVGIYAKMSVDALLRNKLFERGLLEKLIPLLEIESTRYMALRALTTVTQHGGVGVRTDIALHSDALCKVAEEHPDDPQVGDLVVSILAHCVGAAVEGNEGSPTHPKVLNQLNMSRILNTIVQCMNQSSSNRSCIEHGAELIASATLHAPRAYKNAPEATKVLIAGLRSHDWNLRSLCLGGLMRLHKLGSEDDTRQLDPQRLVSVINTMPGELQDVMMNYGLGNCDIYATLSAAKDFTRAIMAYPQDLNLHSLGLKLAKIIVTTEFSIADGYYETINERTGRREQLNFPGMAFQRYTDALPVCAKAIRTRGIPGEQDDANVLDIKFKIMRQRVGEAAEQARKALEKNPNFAYYHYAVSLVANHTNGLRAAKKGMKCKTITPFIKFQLMQRAVEHSAELGLTTLQEVRSNGEDGDNKWAVGVAFLTSALEDARRYIQEAPPDSRYMKNVTYWFVLLTAVVSETVTEDLSEVKEALEVLKVADGFSKVLGLGPPKTMLRLTQETVVRLFKQSVAKYSDIFERASGGEKLPEVAPDQMQDDLAAWLDDLHLDCDHPAGEEHGHDHGEHGKEEEKPKKWHTHPKLNANTVSLYRCSHCGNPSASLKKCSGCEKARYCDGTCQKAHWAEHKKRCGREPPKPTVSEDKSQINNLD
ncbi:hypothetical protein D9611_007973 [Ephemerocybe angulata]|uniref:MYND-type domain-containing protein n=1 Tax=Ephemerocybe angulata TaxID=980116 RepID=A0A8H5CFN4_9AGAR|nr:hypothetical protein D9611_007973 [Tulosesus angulatus]